MADQVMDLVLREIRAATDGGGVKLCLTGTHGARTVRVEIPLDPYQTIELFGQMSDLVNVQAARWTRALELASNAELDRLRHRYSRNGSA